VALSPCPATPLTRAPAAAAAAAAGIFDLFHFGHARALEQAKTLYPQVYLMVGVCNDADTLRYKGKTVMTEGERYEALRHCKWVDEVVPDAPWVITERFLDDHGIDYVAHDALPYADATGAGDDVYGPVKALGRFRETTRTEGVSTSDLILRIIRDYNDYVLRNLSRGYSREDLGLSLLKEKRIRAGASMRQLGARMQAQRHQVAGHIRRRVTSAAAAAERLPLNREVERNVVGLAEGVESLVGKVVSGEFGENVDKLVTGFISSFERGYLKLERVIKTTLGRNLLPTPKRKRGGAKQPIDKPAAGEKKGKGAAAAVVAAAAAVAEPEGRASKRQRAGRAAAAVAVATCVF
jgi:choline-phosphate cytidylyltransferase